MLRQMRENKLRQTLHMHVARNLLNSTQDVMHYDITFFRDQTVINVSTDLLK